MGSYLDVELIRYQGLQQRYWGLTSDHACILFCSPPHGIFFQLFPPLCVQTVGGARLRAYRSRKLSQRPAEKQKSPHLKQCLVQFIENHKIPEFRSTAL